MSAIEIREGLVLGVIVTVDKAALAGFMLSMRTLARAYLALPALLRESCPAMCVSGIGVDCGVPPDECCDVCGGAGSVLTEDGKRMEEIRSRLYLRMPNTEESEWLLSRLTAALNEIERTKK